MTQTRTPPAAEPIAAAKVMALFVALAATLAPPIYMLVTWGPKSFAVLVVATLVFWPYLLLTAEDMPDEHPGDEIERWLKGF